VLANVSTTENPDMENSIFDMEISFKRAAA